MKRQQISQNYARGLARPCSASHKLNRLKGVKVQERVSSGIDVARQQNLCHVGELDRDRKLKHYSGVVACPSQGICAEDVVVNIEETVASIAAALAFRAERGYQEKIATAYVGIAGEPHRV